MEQVKLLSMTVVVTVLIWAGADSLVNETVLLPVSFDVVPLQNTELRVVLDPLDRNRVYEIELSGPRGLIGDLQKGGPLTLRLGIDDRATGPAEIPLRKDRIKTALDQYSSEFRKVSVVSFQPRSIHVLVDHMVTRQIEVTVNRLSLAYEEEPQLNPGVVTAEMRESVAETIAASGRQLSIDLSAEVERLLRDKPFGVSQQIAVVLNTTELGPDARLIPNQVQVTATVKADRVTADIPTVPIKPVVSFANLGKPYIAVSRDNTPITVETRTITVTGPAEDVARLLRGETRAYGFIHVMEGDLAELGVTKAWNPEFHLPPNLRLAKPPDSIEFKLIDATLTE